MTIRESELLHPLEEMLEIRGTVEEARRQNTFYLGIRYRKFSALRDLMRSVGYSKDVAESIIETLVRGLEASGSKDINADFKMLETILNILDSIPPALEGL